MISNVTGLWADPEQIQTPAYWLTHMRRTVLLSKGFKTLLEQGPRICVEAGPGHGICSFFKDAAVNQPGARAFPLLRSRSEKQKTLTEVDDQEFFIRGMGNLWSRVRSLTRKSSTGMNVDIVSLSPVIPLNENPSGLNLIERLMESKPEIRVFQISRKINWI